MPRSIELLPGESLTLRSGITVVAARDVSGEHPTHIAAAPSTGLSRECIDLLNVVTLSGALQPADWSQIQKLAEHLVRARRALTEGGC